MSWHEVLIENITEVVTKGTTPTTYGMPFTDEGINFVKAEALNGDVSLERSGFAFISVDTHEKLKRSQLAIDDVLITIAGANVGKCGFVREEDLPANTNQAVGIVRVYPEKSFTEICLLPLQKPKHFYDLSELWRPSCATKYKSDSFERNETKITRYSISRKNCRAFVFL